ncbi:MAG: aldose 1-epimerase [Gaiellaceae bacterium]
MAAWTSGGSPPRAADLMSCIGQRPAAARVHRSHGFAAVTLASGELEATFLPELNLLGVSLRLAGEEYLALSGGVSAYRSGHATGLPVLAPWANRLGARSYRSGRVGVDLEGLSLHEDGKGLPIHGTLAARHAWELASLHARGRRARLEAWFEYDRPELLAAFPFPHRLEATIEVDGRSLSVATSLTPTGRRAVPVSFGYHPYLRLPDGRRAAWRLRLPRRSRLELDERGIPTGRSSLVSAESEPIGDRAFDDLFELAGAGTLAIDGAGRRLSVDFGPGYTFAQVFTPPGRNAVCLEPMTAPTNALVSGACPVVHPGETFTARFRITPERSVI